MDLQGQSIIPTTQLPIQAVPITNTLVSLIPINDEIYLMQNVIKLLVTCDRYVIFKVYCHDIIEILLKVKLNMNNISNQNSQKECILVSANSSKRNI